MHMPEGHFESASFIVSGSAFIRARRNLKPAFPKKKQAPTASVGIVATSISELSLQLPGASATLPAIVSAPFSLQMPWLYIQQLLTDPIDEAAMIQFQVGIGLFKYGDIAVKSTQIVFKPNNLDKVTSKEADTKSRSPLSQSVSTDAGNPPMPDLVNSPMGLPLIAAYSYIRKFGYQRLLGDQAFVAQEAEVIKIFKKATDLLMPLGIRREDLQKILDERHGFSGDYPIDDSR
jgi:hypothetical protein